MTTPQPVKRRWIPGLEKRIAAGDNGILYRYKKTTKTLEPIPVKSPNQVVTLRRGFIDIAYPYAYLIAAAFLDIAKAPETKDPTQRPRVGFADGNRLNTRPSNLYWLQTGPGRKLDQLRAREALKASTLHTQQNGEFRQLDGLPDFYTKDDGTLWKLQQNGDLKIRRPTTRHDGHLEVNLAPYYKRRLLLKEIIADIYLPPRPTPKHRAYMVDGNPNNTRPMNLQWRYSYQAPPYPYKITAAAPNRTTATRSEEAHARFYRTMDALTEAGARRLTSDLRLWATPDGLIYWIDHETGTRSLIRSAAGRIHIPGGFMDASGRTVFSRSTRGITAGNIVFDAFPELTAEAAKHPDELAPRRTTHQATYPKDGNPDNTRPENLLLMATPHATRTFQFIDPADPESYRSVDTTPPTPATPTAHQDAAHSEPPAGPTDPEEFIFDL